MFKITLISDLAIKKVNSNCLLHCSSIRKKSFKKWYQEFWSPKINGPPFSHITQIGDPVLRTPAARIPDDKINSEDVDYVINKMIEVLRKFNCVGIAAPQIGVSLRIIAMEFKENLKRDFPKTVYEARGMSTLPLTVLINPELQIVSYKLNNFPEGCMSVRGFSADVPRYDEVQLKGIAKIGSSDLHLKGWNARIAQHEVDHLNAKLYIDHMDRSTFKCNCWEQDEQDYNYGPNTSSTQKRTFEWKSRSGKFVPSHNIITVKPKKIRR